MKSSFSVKEHDLHQWGRRAGHGGPHLQSSGFYVTTQEQQPTLYSTSRPCFKSDGKAAVVLPDQCAFEGGAETIQKLLGRNQSALILDCPVSSTNRGRPQMCCFWQQSRPQRSGPEMSGSMISGPTYTPPWKRTHCLKTSMTSSTAITLPTSINTKGNLRCEKESRMTMEVLLRGYHRQRQDQPRTSPGSRTKASRTWTQPAGTLMSQYWEIHQNLGGQLESFLGRSWVC